MNYAAMLVWCLICILVIWLVLLPTIDAVDYFPNNINLNKAGGWTHTPTVCLDNPPHKFYALKAAKSWELAFQKRLQTHDYDYKILIIDDWDYRCNILITFEDPNNIWNETSHAGAMGCYKIDNSRYCRGAVNPESMQWYNILVHELGHAWGLGHRNSYEKEGFPFVVMEEDIMFNQAQNFQHITANSIDALDFFYMMNGWNGAILANYTVPHNNE